MDILDIDEVLKDDSFCLLEENNLDDISNILQRWKNNGSTEQGSKFDARTFTRPKKSSIQNLESNFVKSHSKDDNTTTVHSNNSNVNLQIGGLVTSLQKSFLQDTSPPISISSSMDFSTDSISNNLITSADFTNVSFLKIIDDISSNIQVNGYSFNDVIKDRKALENLTFSNDTTLIKDSNIAQTDEIIYVSKTNSASSTMQNSTENNDFIGFNETYTPLNDTIIVNNMKLPLNETFLKESEISDTNCSAIDDLITNTTIDLVNSMQLSDHTDKIKNNNKKSIVTNQTFCAKTNRTYDKVLKEDWRTEDKDMDETFDLYPGAENESLTKVETPKSENQNIPRERSFQSTPQQSTNRMNSLFIDTNISPIVSDLNIQFEQNKQQETFKKEPSIYSPIIVEEIKSFQENQPPIDNNVILNDLDHFQNDVELLSEEKNEKIFDTMLDDIGKTKLTEENLKIKRTVDNIKKRYSLSTGNFDKDQYDLKTKQNNNEQYIAMTNSRLSDCSGKTSLSTSGGSGTERLLNRRSRLYDDIHLTKLESDGLSSNNKKIDNILSDDNQENHQKLENMNDFNLPISAENYLRNEKRHDRNHDRFKTIRIFKKPIGENEHTMDIDINMENEEYCEPTIERKKTLPRYVKDDRSEIQSKSKNTYQNIKTYRKESLLNKPIRNLSNEISNGKNSERNECTNGLNENLPKANSAGDLDKTINYNTYKKTNNNPTIVTNQSSNLKSPMGTKAKSFHNLAGHFGFTNKMSNMKPNSQPSLLPANNGTFIEKKKHLPSNQINRISSINRTAKSIPNDVEKIESSGFKVPDPVSNLVQPNSRRTGLIRPSSGFYSSTTVKNLDLNVEPGLSQKNAFSTVTCRNSLLQNRQKYTNGNSNEDNPNLHEIKDKNNQSDNYIRAVQQNSNPKALSNNPSRNIPKPSGLVQPSSIRKSGLPRPSSIFRR